MFTGKHKRIRLFTRPKSDLKKRLKEIMTSPSTGPYCLSENRELFQRVMEEFYHYEENVSPHLHVHLLVLYTVMHNDMQILVYACIVYTIVVVLCILKTVLHELLYTLTLFYLHAQV